MGEVSVPSDRLHCWVYLNAKLHFDHFDVCPSIHIVVDILWPDADLSGIIGLAFHSLFLVCTPGGTMWLVLETSLTKIVEDLESEMGTMLLAVKSCSHLFLVYFSGVAGFCAIIGFAKY